MDIHADIGYTVYSDLSLYVGNSCVLGSYTLSMTGKSTLCKREVISYYLNKSAAALSGFFPNSAAQKACQTYAPKCQ